MKKLFIIGAVILSASVSAFAEERAAWVRKATGEMCASEASVLVVDKFFLNKENYGPYTKPKDRTRNVDLNGDGDPDGSHGDVTAAVLRSTGKKYQTYNVPHYLDVFLLGDFFRQLADSLESGEIAKPAFISMSLSLPISTEIINSMSPSSPVTSENIAAKKQVVLEAIFRENTGPIYRSVYDSFARIAKLGIPVVTAAGNEYSKDMYNFYSLLPGVITVGAYEYDGKTIAAYSNENSLVDVHRIGHILVRSVDGGIDLNGDGRPEISDFRLTRQAKVVRLYTGHRADEAVKNYPPSPSDKSAYDIYRQGRIPPGLYKIDDILEKIRERFDFPEVMVLEVKAHGGYFHFPSRLVFQADDEGILHYRPAGFDDPTLIHEFSGTSFATPRICAK